MPKGISELYNEICNLLETGTNFIDWMPSSLCSGMICKTVAWYVKTDRWYLEEAGYDPMHESNSTWYARKYAGRYPSSNTSNVMKYFKLEKMKGSLQPTERKGRSYC